MNHFIKSVALSVCFAGSAFAQTAGDQGGAVGLSYTGISNDNLPDETSVLSIWSIGAYNFTPSIGVQYGVQFDRYSFAEGGSGIDIDVVDFDLHAYYNINANTKVGVFVSDVIFDQLTLYSGGSSMGINPDIFSLIYGGEIMTSFSGFEIEAYAGVGSMMGDDIGGTDVTMMAYGGDVSYQISSAFEVYGDVSYLNFDIESGSASLTFLTYAGGVEYAFNPDLRIIGEVRGGYIDLDGSRIDMFGYGARVEYDFPLNIGPGSELMLYASVGNDTLSPEFSSDSESFIDYTIGVEWSFGGYSDDTFFSGPSLY